MSDKNKKLTPEQLKQIQMLQQMMQQQKGGGAPGGAMPDAFGSRVPQSQKPPKQPWTVKGTFMATLQKMAECVKFIDQFVHLVIKKDHTEKNDVVDNARSPILFGAFVTIFFVIFGFAWASTAPLDSAAHAMGTVVSSSKKKEVNHPEGGILEGLHVQIGDEVKSGDKLVTLNEARMRSEYESVLNSYRNLLAAESRLQSAMDRDTEVEYPEFLLKNKEDPNVAKLIANQNKFFHSRYEAFKGKKDSLMQNVKQHEKKIEGTIARKKASVKNLEVIQIKYNSAKKLLKNGYAKKETVLEIEAKIAELEGNIASLESEIISYEQEITKTNLQIANADNEYDSEISNELKQVQRELSGAKEKYVNAEQMFNRTILRAPVDGIINKINFHTIGSLVPQGQPIVEISPSNDRLVIEAKILPKNIDSVNVGLVANVRFSAFKSRTTPTVKGKVVALSPDIIQDPRMQGNPEFAGGYYEARIEIDMDNFNEIAEQRGLVLQAGMQADITIVTGTRTLLRYLLDPIFDAMFKGFKEK